MTAPEGGVARSSLNHLEATMFRVAVDAAQLGITCFGESFVLRFPRRSCGADLAAVGWHALGTGGFVRGETWLAAPRFVGPNLRIQLRGSPVRTVEAHTPLATWLSTRFAVVGSQLPFLKWRKSNDRQTPPRAPWLVPAGWSWTFHSVQNSFSGCLPPLPCF